jgi:hypothetical protein
MPGQGPAPKGIGNRRRYGQPTLGEWVDLEPLQAPVLGPGSGKWPPAARRLWNAIRKDPVSSQYTDADIGLLRETMANWERLLPHEQRLRMEMFGISPKGRRALRFRTALEARQQEQAVAKNAEVRRLRVTAEKDAA